VSSHKYEFTLRTFVTATVHTTDDDDVYEKAAAVAAEAVAEVERLLEERGITCITFDRGFDHDETAVLDRIWTGTDKEGEDQ